MIVALVAVLLPNPCWASASSSFPSSDDHGVSKIYHEQIAPTFDRSTDSTSVILWSSGALAYFLVKSIDGDLKEQWQDHRQMSDLVARIGDRYVLYGFNIGIALTQYFVDHDNGVSHIRALMFTGATTGLLKASFRRQRPDESDHLSFPSGHTSSAFATATSLSMAYGWRAGVPAYSAAVLTGLSRMADNKHWASDVVAGGFLGFIWGRAGFFNVGPADGKTQTQILPIYENGFAGLELTRRF